MNTVDNIQVTPFRTDCPKIAFCGLVRKNFKQKPATCGFFTTGAFTANPKRMTVTLESATHSYIALYLVIVELAAGPRCDINHLMVRKYLTLSDIGKIFVGCVHQCIHAYSIGLLSLPKNTGNLASNRCNVHQHMSLDNFGLHYASQSHFSGKLHTIDSLRGLPDY